MEIREIKQAQLTGGGKFNGGEGKYFLALDTLNFNQRSLANDQDELKGFIFDSPPPQCN